MFQRDWGGGERELVLKPSPGVQKSVEKGLHPKCVREKEENHGDF